MKRQSKRRTSVLPINITQTRRKVTKKDRAVQTYQRSRHTSDVSRRSQYDARRRPKPNARRQSSASARRQATQKQKVSATNWATFFARKIRPVTHPKRLHAKNLHVRPRHSTSITTWKLTSRPPCKVVLGLGSLASFYLRDLQRRWRKTRLRACALS